MNNRVAMLTAGFLLGALVIWLSFPKNAAKIDAPMELVRDIVVVEEMTASVTEEHRRDRYEALKTVAQIYALPSEFGRAEALYAIAGRSDALGVQNLAFQANRIADTEDRAGALDILFFRLAELDPQSALALARTGSFYGDGRHERRVWIAWGRRDIDAALVAAKEQPSKMLRNKAAQSLLVAFGYMGNETTDRIEREIGIGPDRNTRARFIYQLADESPPKAIAFINQMRPGVQQQEFVS
ncbi:MAG: hypothetical protein O7F71_00515, partial [Gammaproteobacteria bacterium]|nr:hypothetical protein [Gammaproteobacteria bacterium]